MTATGSAEIRERQQMLVKEGYVIVVDGVDGEATQRAYLDHQAKQREKAAAEDQRARDAAAAEREQRQQAAQRERDAAATEQKRQEAETAAANARAAEAQAKATEAAARAAETKAAAEAGKREADSLRAAVSTPLTIAAVATGLIAGKKIAAKVEQRHAASIAAKNAQLAKAADEIGKLQKQARKQKGAQKTATTREIQGRIRGVDRAGLLKGKGSLAIAGVLALGGEAVLARVLASREQEGWTRDLLNETGVGFGLAASSLLGQRLQDLRQPKNLLDQKSVGTIEGARKAVDKAPRNARGGAVGRAVDAIVGPPKPGTARAVAKPAVITPSAPAALTVVPAATPKALPAPAAASGLKIAGKIGRGLGVVGLALGALSVFNRARAEGVAAAGAEALRALDPTGGLATRAIEKLNEPAQPSLLDQAKAQRADRQQDRTGSETLARDAASAVMGEQPINPSVGPMQHVAAAVEAGAMPAGQAEYAQRLLESSGLQSYYGVATPGTLLERTPYMGGAAEFAREQNNAPKPDPQIPAAPTPQPTPAPFNGPRGWANPTIQAAAQRARREKGLI